MIIRSDQLNCYIEGVNVPIFQIAANYVKNSFGKASIIIPVGGVVIPKMWANAFIQVTYVSNEDNNRKERLLFQGICIHLVVDEEHGRINIEAVSMWDSLNLNSTLDYTSPKRYGLSDMEKGIVIYVGNEDAVTPEFQTGYKFSERFYYVDSETDIANVNYGDPEALKLQFIADRAPFAERYAYSLFEDLSYENFILSRSYLDRFNLLSKSQARKNIEQAELQYTSENIIGVTRLRMEETALFKQWSKGKHEVEPPSKTFDQGDGSQTAIIARFGQPVNPAEKNPNIVRVNAKCGKNGAEVSIMIHKLLADDFVKMFQDLSNAGLSNHIEASDCFAAIHRPKNTAQGPSSELSLHSWAIAFDINVAKNGLGTNGTPGQKILADFFKKYGWLWGGDWSPAYRDPMHFQIMHG